MTSSGQRPKVAVKLSMRCRTDHAPSLQNRVISLRSKDTKVEDLDQEPWHEGKSIKFSHIKRKRRSERRRGRNRKRVKRERGRQADREGFQPQRLSNPSSPTSHTTLARHLPSLNLILHIREVRLIARPRGTEVRKVRIQGCDAQEVCTHGPTRPQEGRASP